MEDRPNISPSTGQTYEFRNPQDCAVGIAFAFGISLLMIIVIAVSLFSLFTSSSHKPLMPGIIGGMSVIPIFGIWTGIYLLKRPRKIIAGPQGVVIVGLTGRKEIPWSDIADIEIKEVENVTSQWVKTFSGQSAVANKCIVLRNHANRQIGAIDGNIENFDFLTATITSYCSVTQGKSVYDADLQKNRTIASRKKKMRLNLVLGLFLFLMAIASMTVISIDHFQKQALENEGLSADATIKRIYIYNVTPRLEYTFSTPDGKSYSKDVMVSKELYDQWKEGQIIAVKYVPSDPDNSRLLRGHVEDFDVPFGLLIVFGIVIVAIGAGTLCMYYLKIVDIKHENGKWKIVRLDDPEPVMAQSPTAAAFVGTIIPQHQEAQQEAIPMNSPELQTIQQPVASHEKKTLPGGLKAIGILNILFGSLGAMWNGVRIILLLLLVSRPDDVFLPIMIPEEWGWVMASHSFALLCAVGLCISGIGILRLANWGRILAICAAAAKLALGLWDMFDVMRISTGDVDSQQQTIAAAVKGGYVFVVVLTLIYPVIVLILMLRRSTRQCFQKK